MENGAASADVYMSEKQIYQLSDGVCFRLCEPNDCTDKQAHWSGHGGTLCSLNCSHEGRIHLHCCFHRDIELVKMIDPIAKTTITYICTACENTPGRSSPTALRQLSYSNADTIKQKAKALLNSKKFKGARFIRLDDYYVPELSGKDLIEKDSKYWASYDVKKTKTGNPLLILYVGSKENGSKAQFFIEPESKKLSHDHKDSDPLSIIARIEVEFKDGSIELRDKNDDTK